MTGVKIRPLSVMEATLLCAALVALVPAAAGAQTTEKKGTTPYGSSWRGYTDGYPNTAREIRRLAPSREARFALALACVAACKTDKHDMPSILIARADEVVE